MKPYFIHYFLTTSQSTPDFLNANLPRYVPKSDIPPNSPALNPLDYCIWNALKEGLNKLGLIQNIDRLNEILKREWEAIP